MILYVYEKYQHIPLLLKTFNLLSIKIKYVKMNISMLKLFFIICFNKKIVKQWKRNTKK